MTSERPRPTGWERLMRRLLPGWFRSVWGREVNDMLEAERAEAKRRGVLARVRFAFGTFADLVRAAWQLRGPVGAGWRGDVRVAARMLRRSPGFTSIAVGSLAIGVAVNATAFSVLDPALFQPLPWPEADRMESVRVQASPTERAFFPTYASFRTWQSQTPSSVEAVVAYQLRWIRRDAPGGVERDDDRLNVQTASRAFLSMLDVEVARGRGFADADYRADAAPVILVSHDYWQRDLGGRSDVVGNVVPLDGIGHTIIGVVSPEFRFEAFDIDAFRPMAPGTSREPDDDEFLRVVVRRRTGASQERVAAELASVLPRTARDDDRPSLALIVLLQPIRAHLYGWAWTNFGPFAGVGVFLLLLVVANLANLSLVRAAGRGQELALRTALGAGRWRVARLVGFETVLITLAAGGLGILLAHWTIGTLVRLDPNRVSLMAPAFDLRVVACAAGVALVAGAAAALWPAVAALQANALPALRQGVQQGTDSTRQRLVQRSLVVCQVVSALVVVTGAGLLTKTIFRMQHYDPGVGTTNLLTAYVDLPADRYPGTKSGALLERLLEQVRAAPGVAAAGVLSSHVPAAGEVVIEAGGERFAPALMARGVDSPGDRVGYASSGYFDTVGLPTLRGRPLASALANEFGPVAVVNEEAAVRWWQSTPADVIGSRIRVDRPDRPGTWATVVGVVKTSGWITVQALAWKTPARVYFPLTQAAQGDALYVRTHGDPEAILPALDQAVRQVDPAIRIESVDDARASMEAEIAYHRVNADILLALAAFGMLLAAMGIYGVTAYAVARRTREIGIRKALGAGAGHVLRTLGRESALLAAIGIVVGLGLAAAVTRVLESMLFGTDPLDPIVFAIAAAVVAAIVAIATYLPARRALRIDPMRTLRSE